MTKFCLNGSWLKILCASLIFASGCANTASTIPEKEIVTSAESDYPQEESQINSTGEKSSLNEPLWRQATRKDFNAFPDRLWDDTKLTFTRPDNITLLLLAGGASIAMHQEADEEIADYFEKHQKLRNLKDESLYIIGHPTTHFAASTLWYYLSAHSQDDLNRQRAWTMRTALSITWLTTWGLKITRNNETPNDNEWSWPSGHASSSFTVASVLDEFYGPRVGIPAYAVASLVSYRMMDTGDHWASDIVFGATLGWVVGHTVAGKHKELEIAGFEIVPFIPQTLSRDDSGQTEKPVVGIALLKRF